MSDISRLSPHPELQARTSRMRQDQSPADFRAMLDPVPSSLSPISSSKATQFGANGMFAPRRIVNAASVALNPDMNQNTMVREAGAIADEDPGEDFDTSAPQDSVTPPRHLTRQAIPVPTVDVQARQSEREQMTVAASGVSVLPQPATGTMRYDFGSRTQAHQVGATPRLTREPVGGEIRPVALTITLNEGVAHVVARADAVPADALVRISRILKDRGIALAKLRLNGQDIVADHLRTQGGFDGGRSR